MVEKSGVEMSSLYKVKGHFNPGLFNHELFNPMVQKFMVEKSGVERSGVEMSFNLLWCFFLEKVTFMVELNFVHITRYEMPTKFSAMLLQRAKGFSFMM